MRTVNLPLDMQQVPRGYPESIGVFFECCDHVLKQPELRERFMNETGHDMTILFNVTARALKVGSDNMVIELVENKEKWKVERKLISDWLDWIVLNIFGAEAIPEIKQ